MQGYEQAEKQSLRALQVTDNWQEASDNTSVDFDNTSVDFSAERAEWQAGNFGGKKQTDDGFLQNANFNYPPLSSSDWSSTSNVQPFSKVMYPNVSGITSGYQGDQQVLQAAILAAGAIPVNDELLAHLNKSIEMQDTQESNSANEMQDSLTHTVTTNTNQEMENDEDSSHIDLNITIEENSDNNSENETVENDDENTTISETIDALNTDQENSLCSVDTAVSRVSTGGLNDPGEATPTDTANEEEADRADGGYFVKLI